jgi:hypothetical protein
MKERQVLPTLNNPKSLGLNHELETLRSQDRALANELAKLGESIGKQERLISDVNNGPKPETKWQDMFSNLLSLTSSVNRPRNDKLRLPDSTPIFADDGKIVIEDWLFKINQICDTSRIEKFNLYSV